MKWHFVAQPAGVMCPAVARVAFCLYLLKFVGTGMKIKRVLWFIILTQWMVNLVTMVEILVSCRKFEMLWDPSIHHRCLSPIVQAYIGYFQGGSFQHFFSLSVRACSNGSAAWNSLTDLILTFLPYLMLKDLNMELKTKLALSVIMGLSIFAMVACIVKTIELQVLGSRDDFTYHATMFIVWLTIESYVIIIAASIPTLRPLALRLCQRRADRKAQKCSRRSPSLPPYDSGTSWSSRPNLVRLNSVRSDGKLELEPPYIHPKQMSPPPAGTIRKTISIYVRSESDVDDIELEHLSRGLGVHTRISAGGRFQDASTLDDGWMTARTEGRSRRRSGSKTAAAGEDADVERQ